MDILINVILIIIGIIERIIIGFVCRAIVNSKGYNIDNGFINHGFAWGFWLGIIGVIVCACKREVPIITDDTQNNNSDNTNINNRKLLNEDYWYCPDCGKLYSKYATECECGYIKQIENNDNSANEDKRIEQLIKYKKLLDNGAITEEEYNDVKKRILG